MTSGLLHAITFCNAKNVHLECTTTHQNSTTTPCEISFYFVYSRLPFWVASDAFVLFRRLSNWYILMIDRLIVLLEMLWPMDPSMSPSLWPHLGIQKPNWIPALHRRVLLWYSRLFSWKSKVASMALKEAGLVHSDPLKLCFNLCIVNNVNIQ